MSELLYAAVLIAGTPLVASLVQAFSKIEIIGQSDLHHIGVMALLETAHRRTNGRKVFRLRNIAFPLEHIAIGSVNIEIVGNLVLYAQVAVAPVFGQEFAAQRRFRRYRHTAGEKPAAEKDVKIQRTEEIIVRVVVIVSVSFKMSVTALRKNV